MKLTQVSATYGRKFNLGDYESMHIEISLWAQLDDNDDEAEASEALRQMARNHVMAEAARVKRELRAKTENLFMGLPVDVQKDILEYEEVS